MQVITEETKTAPIVYDLDSEYLDYVALTVQKVKATLINDIKELSDEYQYSDELLEDLFTVEANFYEEET